jgi:hypothetical protein
MTPRTTNSGMNVATDTASPRTSIGREIPDNPGALAAAAPAKLVGSPSADSINSGFACTSQVPNPVAPRVDQKNLVTGADSRKSGDTVKASMDQIANPPGPREQMRGQVNSRNYNESGKAFKPTAGAEEAGD